MKTSKEKLERIVLFSPAWDKRSKNPKKDYGIHSMQCWMMVKGKKGVSHFTFATGILLESTMIDYIKDGRASYQMLSPDNPYWLNKPMGFDVGYHAYKKQYQGQQLHSPTKMIFPKKRPTPKQLAKMGKDETWKYLSSVKFKKKYAKPPKCEWIGKPCYCDGSAMEAERYFNILLEKGSEPIWKMLEAHYKSLK